VYIGGRFLFNRHFDRWGGKLVEFEKRGLLSSEMGAAWKDVLADEAMEMEARNLLADSAAAKKTGRRVAIVDGVRVSDYPSLSVIRRLNKVQEYSNNIEITDRKARQIALIRTNHRRAKIDEFPPTLITALIAAEDSRFRVNRLGFEFDSYVRAVFRAVFRSVTKLTIVPPQGTSTITQQVAKLFISDIDTSGRRIVGHTLERKVREMRLAAALRKMYSPDDILEVYLNHCVTSDYGLIGYKDIAEGLLGKRLGELTDAECIYLARMVKWGRNIHAKIARQCRIDMPRMAAALGWDADKRAAVLAAVDSLTFKRPKQVQTEAGHLVDCANEFWLQIIQRLPGGAASAAEMNIIDPNSLIRRKGNLSIQLTIDLPLQRELQRLVDGRGYGRDTVITTDVRVGSFGETVVCSRAPADTLRRITVLDKAQTFAEPGSRFFVTLAPGDTLVTNVRYQKAGAKTWRRSVFYYTRRPVKVEGQYFAYCIIDAASGKLLAYYSRDKIGSRLVSLLSNRTPNGSSTAKPIFHALNFDFGHFKPFDMWTDSLEVTEDVPWKRSIVMKNGRPWEVSFAHSAVRGKDYRVHNHANVFEGCQYVFELLATSNNILGTEMVYRMNTSLDDGSRDALLTNQFLYRLGAFGRITKELNLTRVTGVRLYKEMARIVGVDVDSMTAYGKRIAVSDSLYSIGLGTLELTLYEQAHLFNALYNNDLIVNPARHPSLVLEDIVLNGTSIPVSDLDTVTRCHPFSDINNLRPVYLGMHKRLTSNAADGLSGYDIEYAGDMAAQAVREFDEAAYAIEGPLSNYAKSGTTDDVLRPFNVDVTSEKRTNYGLWNATIRIDLSKLSGEEEPEIRDITIACIGECNYAYTGERDGKTLHKFVSRGLLQKAGIAVSDGFYRRYEAYLRAVTPDSVKNCGAYVQSLRGAEEPHGLRKLLDMLPFGAKKREAREQGR